MHEFLRNTLEWILDKEEQSADACRIPVSQIDKQIAAVQAKKEKYEAQCNDNLHELGHVLFRLQKMREEHQDCGE